MKTRLSHHLMAALLGVAFTAGLTLPAEGASYYNTNFASVGNAWIPQGPAPMTNSPGVAVVPNNDVAGAINAILPHPTDPNILYVGAVNGGVWKSTNATQINPDWTPLSDFMPSPSIGALAFDRADPFKHTVVAGLGDFSSFGSGGPRCGIMISTDEGASWDIFGGTTLSNARITAVTMNSNVLFAASSGGKAGLEGLFRSLDGGTNWAQVDTLPGNNLPAGAVTDVLADPLDPQKYYAAMPGVGIYGTGNNGTSWLNLTGTNTVISFSARLELAAQTNGVGNVALYTAVHSGTNLAGVFQLLNPGPGSTNWIPLDFESKAAGTRADLLGIAAHPGQPGLIAVSGQVKILLIDASQPPGSQLTVISSNSFFGIGPRGNVHVDTRSLAFDANDNIIECDDGGVYRLPSPYSTNEMWQSLNGNAQITEIHSMAYDPLAKVLLGGTQDNSWAWQTAAGSPIWVHSGVEGDAGDVAVDATSTPGVSIRYGGGQYLNSFLAHYFDANNQQLSNKTVQLNLMGPGTPIDRGQGGNLQFVTPLELNRFDPTHFIIAGADSLYESTNSGANVRDLQAVGSVKQGAIAYGGILNGQPSTNVLWAAAFNDVYLRTTGGPGAAPILTAGACPATSRLQAIQLNPNDATRAFVCDESDVYVTLNGGTNWSALTYNLTNVGTLRCMKYIERPGSDWLVVGTDSGIYSLTVGGGVWTELGSGLPTALVFDLDYDPTEELLFAGTLGRGAFLLPIGSTLLVENTNDSGPGSLRQAIIEANASIGSKETIKFRIPGDGPHTISPLTSLPAITDPVAISGWSQTGVAGSHEIEIEGSQCSGGEGLTLTTSNSIIRGLVINRFSNRGILIAGADAKNNWIYGNYIGTDPTGTNALGNVTGIRVGSGASGNLIGTDADGSTDLAEANLISGNTGDGVLITSTNATGNRISGNRIFDNGGLGIRLGTGSPVPNDAGDADTGPNNLQNRPSLEPANYANVLVGSLSSTSNTTYRIEFFANTTCDGSGFGGGESYLGATNVTTGPGGGASIVFTFAAAGGRTNFTATATDPDGNTSDFSMCVIGGLPNLPPLLTNMEVLGNGSFQFAFTNSIGGSFDVFASPNVNEPLNLWSNLGPAIEVAPGIYQFSDPGATNAPRRFYTVRAP